MDQQRQGAPYANAVTRTASPTPRQPSDKCALCNLAHHITECGHFVDLSVNDRAAKMVERKLCFRCGNHGHGTAMCPSDIVCNCGKRHHPLIHGRTNFLPPKRHNNPRDVAATTTNGNPSTPAAAAQASIAPLMNAGDNAGILANTIS